MERFSFLYLTDKFDLKKHGVSLSTCLAAHPTAYFTLGRQHLRFFKETTVTKHEWALRFLNARRLFGEEAKSALRYAGISHESPAVPEGTTGNVQYFVDLRAALSRAALSVLEEGDQRRGIFE